MRIGVVTTDIDLPINQRKYDDSIDHFCEKCKKCATNCPAQAISDQSKQILSGVKRWQINSEACFNYWASAGTDCGRCMSACPYSHPNKLLHNTVRWAIKNFPNFRFWAVKLDDFFYGSKPSSAHLPEWLES
jgi:ferredoxin